MGRKDLDYVVIAAMLVSGLYVTISGLIADAFGFPQFFLHRYAGYAWAGLGALHLTLNWGRVSGYLRRRLARPLRPRRPMSGTREQRPAAGRRALLLSVPAAVGGFVVGRLAPGHRTADLPDGISDVGEFYHQWSKPGYSHTFGARPEWGRQPARHKTHADAERVGLPDPRGLKGMSLEGAIQARRSHRTYRAEPLSLEEISRLLYAASGITDRTRGFRAAPSAGALYPVETYPVVHNVAGLERGIYHYVPQEHALEWLQAMDVRAAMVVAGVGQEMIGRAQACFVLSAIFQRTRWRYRERTYRYVLLEAGHIAQNIYLAATSLGLGACAVGAFLDDELNGLVGLDGEREAALYVITVGRV